MGRPFRRTRAGVRVQLDEYERALLARLLEDVDGLLAADAAEREAMPGDGGPAGSLDGGPAGSVDDVLAALEAALSSPPPSDPAVARLLPEGHREDPELAAGFRRLTEHGLRERKRAALDLASSALGRPEPVLLDDGEAVALLKGLTDVRLVLAERLGLKTDEDAELLHAVVSAGPADPRAAAAALYDALTWWQESLVSALH
jgi:Domain of unknown function (DUF2017)